MVDSTIASLTLGSAVSGAELFYGIQGGLDRKISSAQISTYVATANGLPFNVKAYGAVGDGTTNDYSAIQTAIDACDANRGGTVFFPQGRYLINTGLVVTKPGTALVGEGHAGVSSDLANGSARIIVGNGLWGVTFGSASASVFLGARIELLEFCEANAGQALGGVKILRVSNCYFNGVSVGAFTAGTGFLVDGTGDQSQYNTFVNCRFGKCAIGYEQKAANGTRHIGCYFEGSTNGNAPTASSIGAKITSGDTYRSLGTVYQGYDTLVDLSANVGHEIVAARFEVFSTQAVILRGGAGALGAYIHGQADNSLIGGGTGIVISSGVVDPVIDMHLVNVATFVTDNGATRPTIRVAKASPINVMQGLQFNSLAGPTAGAGSGTPEGAVTAPVGSMWLRTNGGASTTLYVKESGSGNTGWVAHGAGGGGGSVTVASNYISADVTMTNASTFYDGPSLSLAAGTYMLNGSATVLAATNAFRTFSAKIWDGTTSISDAVFNVTGTAGAGSVSLQISGPITLASTTTIKISASSKSSQRYVPWNVN